LKKLITLIVPVLNESKNINYFYNEISIIINELCDYDFEILFTDNHSTDDTYEKIVNICNKDNRFRVIRFSRNFGYQNSILTGYLNASGDAVIQLDCDLQDPPLLIKDFLNEWDSGAMVVYGVRASRKEGFIISSFRKIFYRTINFLSEYNLPLDAGDFRLIDRKIIEILKQYNDVQPYLRGAIAEMGFKQVGISYKRHDRKFGKSNFSLGSLVGLAFDGILNHSIIPLRIASLFGLGVVFISFILMITYCIGKLYFNLNWPAGFTTLTILSLLGISVNALFLGIIGEYLGRIYRQVKHKPRTVVEKEYGNFSK
jgi:glycosyltransferase involved in cell wall biosynthesis